MLNITTEEILRLCRLDTADTVNLADANEVLNRQQGAIEATLRPSALADTILITVLRRNIAKLLAAEVLAMRGREEGASGSIQAAGINLSAVPDHAALLRAEADAALLPYRRRSSAPVISPL